MILPEKIKRSQAAPFFLEGIVSKQTETAGIALPFCVLSIIVLLHSQIDARFRFFITDTLRQNQF